MIDNIKEVVKRTLRSAHWMDDDSRAAAIDKVQCNRIY